MAFTPSFFATSMLLLALLAITSAADYGYGATPNLENPKPEPDCKPPPTKPEESGYKIPKLPEAKDELLPTIIGVQRVVLCKSGSNYFPIQGAVARVTCVSVDDDGYDTAPISVLSHTTDSKGCSLATLSISELGAKLKLTECKALLESSPLENCEVPTDVNYGISGARISSYRLLDNNIILHSGVGPFIYTSQTQPRPAPSGY